MERIRQDNENAEGDFSHEAYYDNPPHLSNIFWQGVSSNKAPYVKERVSDKSSDSDSNACSRRRKLIIASIAAAVVLVILGVIGAVLSATLTKSDKEMESKTVERVVKKVYEGQVTFTSKTWTDSLNDKNSTEYKVTEAEFIQKIDAKFSQSDLAEKYDYTVVNRFEQGSVIVVFDIIFHVVIIVEVDNEETLPTTAVGLFNTGVGINAISVMSIFEDDPEFEGLTVSDVNECDSNPCSNGGTCTNDVGQFICTCLPGYTGETCNEDINECYSTPCQNGGICADQINGYTCTCVEGTQGSSCEIDLDECDSSPCQNNGTCEDRINGYMCGCTPGYTGEHCDIDVNECLYDPCKNSLGCQNVNGSFLCICSSGWAGPACDQNINECDIAVTSCQNGATCVDTVGSYTCECSEGWAGKHCDIAISTTVKTSSSDITSITTEEPSQGTKKSPCDAAREYECTTGTISCISTEKRCDGQTDCDDNSDELLCPSTATPASNSATAFALSCGPNEVKCASGTQCVSNTFWCDGLYADCDDASDEADCPNPCTHDQHYCNGVCWSGALICDGQSDCNDDSDEKGCDCPEKRCKNGDCFNANSSCNGIDDCSDGTDEKDCPLTCLENQFKCISVWQETCVNVSQLCDGNRDCPDRSDEWYNCTQTTTATIPLEFEVRLMDGNIDTTEFLYGRIEIRRLMDGEPLGDFGTVCDDSWDSRDAAVLCRSLNASEDGQSYAYGSAAFGEGIGPVWFRNFHCVGDEVRLEECIFSKFAHCSHKQDASVSCGVDRTTSSTSTTQTPAMSSTTISPTGERDPYVRLVGGNNCLEGRVEFLYYNEWATVCDDLFFSTEAIAVCKSLGFSYEYVCRAKIPNVLNGTTDLSLPCDDYDCVSDNTIDSYKLDFGPGTGASYDLFCSNSHERIWDCIIETSNCSHSEDVSVRCAGDPNVLCKIDPSVNCTFNHHMCAYKRTKISGSVGWNWKKGSSVHMTDAENIVDGKVMLYENVEGSETEGARLYSPVFSPSAGSMKVEFYYQLHQSSFKNLIFSVGETMDGVGYEMKELWSSIYLPRDLEYKWLYQCVNLTDLNLSSNYSLIFTAMRGPNAKTVTAVDGVYISEGRCPESLLDGMCTFDQLSVCGLAVECPTCERAIWDYKWIWTNNSQRGHYMLADSSFGSEGDETVMSFTVPQLEDKSVLKFWYRISYEDVVTLEVILYEGDTFHSNLVKLSGELWNVWAWQCVMLPLEIDRTAEIKIKFRAVHGKSGTADIGVDDVKLDNGECPPAVSCKEDQPQCGWITNANNLLKWTFNGVKDPNFEKNSFTLDDANADLGAWALTSSRSFEHQAGEYKFIFEYQKSRGVILQVWYHSFTDNRTNILDKIVDETDFEQFCVDIPQDLNGKISLGITAFKVSNQTVKSAVKGFALMQGHCSESFATLNYTFERKYLMTGYNVSPFPAEGSCKSWHGWTRILASTNKHMDKDHTLQDKPGHYMYADGLSSYSALQLAVLSEEESQPFCSLQFHYFTSARPREDGLFVSVKEIRQELIGIPKVSAWFPSCVALVDTCGNPPGRLNITFEAFGMAAGIDDIMLYMEPCKELEAASVSCKFWEGQTCGYFMDSSAWKRTLDGPIITAANTSGRFLVSQPFDVATNSCISVAFGGSSEYAVEMTVIDSTGETVAASGLVKVEKPKDREIHLDVKPGTGLRLYLDAYYTKYSYLETNELTVYFVNISENYCNYSGLSCAEDEFRCGDLCLSLSNVCDGVRQCEDGTDENCECGSSTFNCTLNGECINSTLECNGFNDCTDGSDESNCDSSVNCTFNKAKWACGYKLFNARKSNASTGGVEMYAELAYIVSPEVSVSTDSCLVIHLGPCSPSNIRISTDDGAMYTLLYNTSIWNGFQTVHVDVFTGSYKGLVIEIQSYVPFRYSTSTIANITLLDQPCESQTIQTTSFTSPSSQTTTQPGITGSTSTTTSAPVQLPDNFPIVEVEQVGILEYGDSVTLSCRVTHNTSFEVILYWRKGSNLNISREDDILLRNKTKTKYSVTLSRDIGEAVYNLTIYDISEDDMDYFSCVVDVLGYTAEYWPIDGTSIQIKEDGCSGIGNTEVDNLCPSFGYKRITVPTVSGWQTLDQVRQAVISLQPLFKEPGAYRDIVGKGCLAVLNNLTCGLHVSHCISGNVVKPVCREHCQDIIGLCGNHLLSSSILNSKYFCKYLPSIENDPDCQALWLECGSSIKIDNSTNGSAVRLRSENYPYGSPSSPRCNYAVSVSRYYTVNVEVSEIMLTDNCLNSYLQVNGGKLCSDNTSKLEQLVDGDVLNMTLFTEAAEIVTGFMITFSQALPTGICDIIEINNLSYQQYDSNSTKKPDCSEWLFYNNTKGYHIELKFTALDGCVKILDKDSNLIQKICDLKTKPEISLYDVVKVYPGRSFKLNYTVVLSPKQDFTIESVRLKEGSTENEGKVFITRSDGKSGYMCGSMNKHAADVICRAAGFASPAIEYMKTFSGGIKKEDIILYDIYCKGDEESLVQCYNQNWKDTCTGECTCTSISSTRGVSCALKSLTCYMNETGSCGYEFDSSKVLPVKNIRLGDGLYTNGSASHITNITSPEFTYLRGDSIFFGYSFDGNPADTLELYLRVVDGSAIKSLWKKAEFTLDGRFTACVQLPENISNKPVQLVFAMSLAPSEAGKDHIIGLNFVGKKYESCQDVLTGNSTYASPDREYPITFSAQKTAGSYIRFKYSQTGAGVRGNDLKFQVRSESTSEGPRTFYSNSEHTPELINVCLRLPSTQDDSFNISFILTTSSSEGSIFLDDISVSDVSCPHPVSCDFEVDSCDFRVNSDSGLYWERNRIFGSHTSGDLRDGYAMQALHNSSTLDIEHRADFQSPVAYLSEDAQYKCLSFLYKTNFSTNAYYKLEVEVVYLDTTEKDISEVEVFIPYTWQKENIKVDPSKSTKVQFSFLITRVTGRVNMPIAVDDVTLLQTGCLEGLQDIKECDFSNPGFCGLERNCTIGSAYMWKVHSGKTSTKTTGPSTDADGNIQGHYLYMDSSLGATGHESYVWFYVDLTNSTSQQYQFFYHMSGDGTAKLETFYRDETTNTYSQKLAVVNMASDMWHLSNCYHLPSSFKGEIYFKAVRGDSVYSDIALDNVRVIDESCKGPSVSCEFSSSKCGYIPNKGGWILKGGYITAVEAGELDVPIYTLTEESCIRFEFEGYIDDFMTLKIDTGFDIDEFNYSVFTDGTNLGQITYQPTVKRMKFVNSKNKTIMIDRVEVESDGCNELPCNPDEKACTFQCVPLSLVCDGNWDCADGSDESDCGFSIPCEFAQSTCGYETVSGSPTDWIVSDSYTFNYKDLEITVFGGMLQTSYKDVSTSKNTSVSSKWQTITEPSCLRFYYLCTVPSLMVTVSNRMTGKHIQWIDMYADMTPISWRPAQMTVEAGTIMVTFETSMEATTYTVKTPNDAFAAIDKIELLSGACETLDPLACPADAGFQCDNGIMCYNDEVKCDGKQYCLSGLDESSIVCSAEFTIPCDFEDPAICGWTDRTITGISWKLSTGNKYQIPQYDHTKNDVTGHFLHSVNKERENFGYERSIVTSPAQIFQEDGCITFWYYLNSTTTQPSALSAQILVSLLYMDSNRTEFLWYDYVDRLIDTWIQGGVPVLANQNVRMTVTSIHFETYGAWPGVVALDDVEYTAGECLPKQACHKRSFACKDSGVCIPEEFICDGKVDCRDKSDEAMCADRPDDTLSLAGGDGSYGQLRYYKNSSWHAVCMFGSRDAMAHWVCKKLGYYGNANVFEYEYVDNDMQAVLLDCNLTSCAVSTCNTQIFSANFAGIMCSNSACFSGQQRCRGTKSVVCVAKERFCDGLPDCPDNSDEEECYCKTEENHCTRTFDECKEDGCQTCADKDMFECQNHQCIDKTKRCDGKKDCSDGLDEYRCVQVNANQVLVNSESELLKVCHNFIGLNKADILCSLSGKGMVTNQGIGHGNTLISNGVMLSETNDAGTLLPGLQISQKTECYPLVLECELPECGTTIYMDRAISPLIVHGDKVVPGEWPHQGYLTVEGSLQCGCSLLGEKWVLTASHCVDEVTSPSTVSVIFGSNFVGDKSPYVQEINVTAVRMHPSYDAKEVVKGYDIAVLQLAYAPNIDAYTRPVCLGREESWKRTLNLGDEAVCYITGFGRTEVYLVTDIGDENPDLLENRVHIVDRETCGQLYKRIDTNITLDAICVENQNPYAPACSGDSGGPLVCKNSEGRWEQFGVTSYGSNNCRSYVPAVYVSVLPYVKWIESITGLNFENHEENVP